MSFVSIIQGVETIYETFEISKSVQVTLFAQDQAYTYLVHTPSGEKEWTFDGRHISCDLNDAHTGVFQAFVGMSDNETKISIDFIS
jgi:hypothetical protein